MLQGICSQKEANTGFYLIQHFLQGLIFILLLENGFMNLYGSLKYLGRHLVMAESVLCYLQKSVSINSPVLLYTPILFYVFPSKISESNLNGIPVHGIPSSLEKGGRVSKGVARSSCSK